MSDIERIRQEIERRKGYISVTHFAEELLAFIDSLPEEKPSEDLKEAAKEYMKKARKHLFDDSPIGRTDDAFIAGAKWQKAKDDLLTIVAIDAGQRARESMTMPELTWKDIRKIVRIADEMLDDPEARVEYNNHNEEYYYEKVLEEYYDR